VDNGGRTSANGHVVTSVGRQSVERKWAWVRSFWDALAPHASKVGGYVNVITEYEDDRVRASYDPAKYDRPSSWARIGAV
jgi:hypothetical protein